MADNNPTGDFEKQIKFKFIIEGGDELAKFITKVERLKGLQKVVKDFAKQQAKLDEQMKKAGGAAAKFLKRENILLRSKDKLQIKLSKSQAAQIKSITKAARAREKQLQRESRITRQNLRLSRGGGRGGGGGGGLSIGRLGGAVAGLGLGFAAVRQIQQITDRRLETFLNLGRGATGRIDAQGGRGIAGVSKFGLLSEFQGANVSQFIQGQSEAIQAGLLRAQEDLSKLGTDVANKLLAEISKSFGADVQRRREFFETTSQRGIEPALQKFIGQFNFPEFSRAINALESPDDPTLQLRGDFAKTVEALKSSFEKLVVTVGSDLIPIVEKLVPKFVALLQSLANLTTGKLLGGAAVGVGGLIATRVAGGALVRGIAGKALGAAGAGVAGLGAVGVGSAVLAADQFTRFAQGKGTIGGSITDKLFGFDEKQTEINRKGDRELLRALGLTPREFEKKQKRLQEQEQQQTEKRLQAQRKETKALDKATKSAEKFADNVKAPSRRDALASRIERREELVIPRQLQESLSSIRREEVATARLSPFGPRLALDKIESLNVSLRKQQDNLRQLLSTFDEDDPRGQLESTKVQAQLASIDRELRTNQLAQQQAPLQIGQAETDLRRQEFQLRRLSPLGTVGAFPELQRIDESLRDEIEILNRMAASAELSAFETINVKRAILSRELEIKQNQRAFLDAFKDQALQQAAGAGRFSKVLFSRDKNVGIGLRKGVFGLDKKTSRALLGNVDPSITPRTPRTAAEILAFNPFAVGQRRPLVKPRSGATSADSIANAGRFLVQVGEQIKQEQQDTDRFAEPITTYAGNRLLGVQPPQ